MQHLLVINGKPLRIGTKEQMQTCNSKFSKYYGEATISPVQEVKRIIPYYYFVDSEMFGSSLFIFQSNAKIQSDGKPVFELPSHTPQGILL